MLRRISALALLLLAVSACGGALTDEDKIALEEDGFGDSLAPAPDEQPLPTAEKADGVCVPRAGSLFPYLDDNCSRKRFPSNRDRAWTCRNVATTATPTLAGTAKQVVYRPSGEQVQVDETALAGIVPNDLKITVILVRRVNGVPHYRYLSNGTSEEAVQPWSSTKWMAALNGAAELRRRSNGLVGLTSSVSGIPLGDLVTVIETYQEQRFTSNGLARWFHNVGGRANANALVHDAWLQRPLSETFGGNYGMPAPALPYTFVEPTGARVSITPDASTGPANNLSTHTMAEFLKRLALHREDARTRMPALQWADVETLFYGAKASSMFPGRWGGMSADEAIYVQSALDVAALEARSKGEWRIFSKLGYGSGQFVENSYACLPAFDANGQPIPDVGKEFVISTRLAAGGASDTARDQLLGGYYRAIVSRILDGRLK